MIEHAGAETARPSLTFGIEMEMVYVHALKDFEQLTGIATGPGQHATAQQRREYVASILRHRLPIGNRTASLLGAVNVTVAHASDYRAWSITEDASIGAGADEISRIFHVPRAAAEQLLHWDQIELISPVFRFHAAETWLLQLRQVQADLASRARLGASFCNDSCGLHVHFAVETHGAAGASAPAFPLRVLQNLVIIWAFWERAIETFHPFHRHPRYCEYALSLLASTRGKAGFGCWQDWAGHVYSLQSSEEIRNFLGVVTNKFVKVYISPARMNKRETVEFREHRGTTDATEVRWWVVFIERVIQYAWRTADAGLRFLQPGSALWNVHNTEDIWYVIEMPEDGRNFLRGKIFEYAQLSPSDFYPPSSSSSTDPAGSQGSMIRNPDEEMDLDYSDDEDVDSQYSTAYRAVDGVQPQIWGEDAIAEEGGNEEEARNLGNWEIGKEGLAEDATVDWGVIPKYRHPDPLQ